MNGFHHQKDYRPYAGKKIDCEHTAIPHTRIHMVAWERLENENYVIDSLDQGCIILATIAATKKFIK